MSYYGLSLGYSAKENDVNLIHEADPTITVV